MLLHNRWEVSSTTFPSVFSASFAVNSFQHISFKKWYSFLIPHCRSVLCGSFLSLTWILDSVMPYRSGHAWLPLLLTGSILKEGSDTLKGERGFLLSQVTLGVSALLCLPSTESQKCSGTLSVFMLILKSCFSRARSTLVFYWDTRMCGCWMMLLHVTDWWNTKGSLLPPVLSWGITSVPLAAHMAHMLGVNFCWFGHCGGQIGSYLISLHALRSQSRSVLNCLLSLTEVEQGRSFLILSR